MSFLKFWRHEKWRITLLVGAISCTAMTTMFLWFRTVPLSVSAVTPRVNSAVDTVLSARRAAVLDVTGIPFGDDETINVLVLGLDSRKEGIEQHCDSIHMVSVNTKDWTVLMTSVPRGTYAYIPPGTYAENEYYLANACAFAGIDYGVEQIERIVGVKSDYVVTAGFSQVLGILRALQLPTTEGLQWLRARQSYAIGDPQRSQNQAVFLKDVALKLFQGDGVPNILFHFLYSLVDTDMDESTARALYDGLLVHGIAGRPDDIALTMKPHHDVQEIHFDPENAKKQIDDLVARLEGRLSRFDLAGRTIEDVQSDLVTYLESVLSGTAGHVSDVVDQQLWLQVEDEGTRQSLEYRFVESYVLTLKTENDDAAVQRAADYILEQQTLGSLVWEAKGRALLERLLAK